MENMPNNFHRRTIENVETGETGKGEPDFFAAGFELTTVVMVKKVESLVLPNLSMQVAAECQALDSIGEGFDLGMDFFPTSIQERDRILEEIGIGSLFLVRGNYRVPKDFPIAVFESQYRPVEPDFSEEEIRKVFRNISGKHDK